MRVGVFVDISNVYHTCLRTYGRKVNFKKILAHISSKEAVVKCIGYGVASTNNDKFINYLHSTGFKEVNVKKPKAFSDGSMKADQDLQIASDILRYVDDYDVLALVSADGDFAPVLKLCKDKGKRVVVVGCGISFELINIADVCTEITEAMLESDKTA